MLPTVRCRLWVESLEDRALPSTALPGGLPADPTPPDEPDSEEAEYRSGGQSDGAGSDDPSPSNGSGAATPPEHPASHDKPTVMPVPGEGSASEATEYGTAPYAAPGPAVSPLT